MERILWRFFTRRARGIHNCSQAVLLPSHSYRDSADLVQLLPDNGLTDINVQGLADHIELVGYYCLKGYWYLFPLFWQVVVNVSRLFSNTAWDLIWERYVSDQELRSIVFDGIVSIEVFFESKSTGPFGYLGPANVYGSAPRSLRVRLSASPGIISDLRCHSSSFSRAPTAIRSLPSVC